MNKRQNERISAELPVKMHFFGEQVDISTSIDISETGFFIETENVRDLDKGVVVLVTIECENGQQMQYLAEVVRITEHGAGFQVIEEAITLAS